jgi:macrolide-specific efflux system membrane fusion protein
MKSLLKRRGLLVNGTLGVLLVGGVGAAYLSLESGGDEPAASARTVTVARGDLVESVSASGSLESAKTGALSFGTSGTVEKIYVEVGDKVEKGAKLAVLDRTEALEELAAAKANLAAAAEKDTDTAQGHAAYVQAQNKVKSAQRALDGTVIHAPFAGTITAVNGSEGGPSSGSSGSGSGLGGGSANSSSSGFIEIANPSKLKVASTFTEADTTKLKVGQSATITFSALSGVTANGRVTQIDTEPTTSNNVVSFGVTITLTGRPAKARIGQTSTVTVEVARADDVLYVPSAAVSTAGGQSTVTVLENGRPVVRTVTTGITGTNGVEIKSGLEEGEQVRLTTASGDSDGASGRGGPGGTGPGRGMPGGGMPGPGMGGPPGGGR